MRILYFAWIKERVGKAEETVAVPADVATVGDLMAWLKGRGEEYAHAFERPDVVRAAIDQMHVRASAPIKDAREVAFFPPVTGG
ncbi:MAG TPA: molybdopterin converting factor subunit 1 [Hyphomicrobiaceae bacterium]|nr:molybdopterin converting factor subunit 1 [Hyphomicrobiaceae bacterium]